MSYLTANQIISMSTAAILNHFGASVEIAVTRSERSNTPIITFRSLNAGVCTALATKHCAVLAKMQADWKPWKGNAAKERNASTYFSTIALKGLRPSTLRKWVQTARAQGFVVDDQVSVVPTVSAEVVSPVDVVTEIPTEAIPVEAIPVTEEATEVTEVTPPPAPTYPALNPIQARVMSLTVKEMKQYLKDIGEKVSGNKSVLRERVMASI